MAFSFAGKTQTGRDRKSLLAPRLHVYRPRRAYRGLTELEHRFHDCTITVTTLQVNSMKYDLGYFDHGTARVESAENPFGAKVLV
jgi:hypothetical protein